MGSRHRQKHCTSIQVSEGCVDLQAGMQTPRQRTTHRSTQLSTVRLIAIYKALTCSYCQKMDKLTCATPGGYFGAAVVPPGSKQAPATDRIEQIRFDR